MDAEVAAQLNEQRSKLAKSLTDAANAFHETASVAERLATILQTVDFTGAPAEQQAQYIAALNATINITKVAAAINGDGTKKRTRKEAKPKAEKDPLAPKKPVSPYIMFQQSIRAEVKAANPELDNKGIMSKIGSLWSDLTESQREPWLAKSLKAKEQHAKDIAAYEKVKLPSEDPAPEAAAIKAVAASKAKPVAKAAKSAVTVAAAPASKRKAVAPATAAEESEESEEETDGETESEDKTDGDSEEDDEEEDSEPQPAKKKQKVDASATKSTPTAKPKKK